MTYQTYEQSDYDGKAVGLYLFTWGNTKWGYTSADRAITYDSAIYQPVAIETDPLVQGGSQDSEFTLRIPANLPVIQLFRSTPPSEPVYLTVRELHLNDVSGEAPIQWIAPIANVNRKSVTTAEILSRSRGLRRGGLRLTWSRACPYAIYGSGCKVNKTLFAALRTITAIAGNVITLNVNSPSTGYFNGGLVEWDADGNGTMERRGIEVETALNSYRMFGRADGMVVGMSLTLYPGCNKSVGDCATKFNNLPNNGGMAFMPGKSPFEGEALL